MTVESFGNIEYNKRDKEWVGLVDNICPKYKVELSISVNSSHQYLDDELELVKKLASDFNTIIAELYDLICNKFKGTEFEISRKEIDKICFLTSVNLKEDNRTWWLVLEPYLYVTSIYNHFLRFTMLDRKIIWTNIDITTTA